MDTATKDDREQVLLVYIGNRLGGSNKLIDLWMEVSQAQFESGEAPSTDLNGKDYRSYSGKSLRFMKGGVGSVYAVPQTRGTTTIFCGEARYQGLWPNDEQRHTWQAEHRADATLVELRRRAARSGAEDELAPLRPLRRKYARTIGRNAKAALLAAIIAFVTAGPVEED